MNVCLCKEETTNYFHIDHLQYTCACTLAYWTIRPNWWWSKFCANKKQKQNNNEKTHCTIRLIRYYICISSNFIKCVSVCVRFTDDCSNGITNWMKTAEHFVFVVRIMPNQIMIALIIVKFGNFVSLLFFFPHFSFKVKRFVIDWIVIYSVRSGSFVLLFRSRDDFQRSKDIYCCNRRKHLPRLTGQFNWLHVSIFIIIRCCFFVVHFIEVIGLICHLFDVLVFIV